MRKRWGFRIADLVFGVLFAMIVILRPFAAILAFFADFFRFVGELTFLLVDTAIGVPRALFSRQGRRLGWQSLWAQMNRVGVKSIPIVCLVLFCIGAILSFQMAPVLAKFGVLDQIPDIISMAVARELGP